MPKTTCYKSLEIIIKSYLILITNGHNCHKQLKLALVYLHSLHFIRENVSTLDIRSLKNKNTLINIANLFLKAPVINRHKLLDRGWNSNLINQFAGEADLIIPNPQFADAPYLHLYSLCKIEKLEEEKEIRTKLVLAETNRIEPIIKDININDWIKGLNILIPFLSIDLLLRNSINSYNNKIVKQFEDTRSLYTKSHVLEQLCLNYIRHECTQYETKLQDLNLVVGCKEAYVKLREDINKKIALTYPDLKNQIYKFQVNNNYIIKDNKPKTVKRL